MFSILPVLPLGHALAICAMLARQLNPTVTSRIKGLCRSLHGDSGGKFAGFAVPIADAAGVDVARLTADACVVERRTVAGISIGARAVGGGTKAGVAVHSAPVIHVPEASLWLSVLKKASRGAGVLRGVRLHREGLRVDANLLPLARMSVLKADTEDIAFALRVDGQVCVGEVCAHCPHPHCHHPRQRHCGQSHL